MNNIITVVGVNNIKFPSFLNSQMWNTCRMLCVMYISSWRVEILKLFCLYLEPQTQMIFITGSLTIKCRRGEGVSKMWQNSTRGFKTKNDVVFFCARAKQSGQKRVFVTSQDKGGGGPENRFKKVKNSIAKLIFSFWTQLEFRGTKFENHWCRVKGQKNAKLWKICSKILWIFQVVQSIIGGW